MRKYPVIFDLETKHTFREFNDPKKLGISVAAVYDYKDEQRRVFTEKELHGLYKILEDASYIIGYNVRSFDIPVLQGYYPGKVEIFTTFDILEDIRDKIGKRLALNDVIYATLGKKKSGHGLMAIDYYKEGKWDELKKYCLDDVLLTKELFDFGVRNKEIQYLNERGKTSIKVDWAKYLEESKGNDMPLTLRF